MYNTEISLPFGNKLLNKLRFEECALIFSVPSYYLKITPTIVELMNIHVYSAHWNSISQELNIT